MKRLLFVGCVSVLALSQACKKDPNLIGGNDAPYYDGIPTLLLENYINRVYIDLIGREPLDVEMASEVAFLRGDSISEDARAIMVQRLQEDTSFIEGDISYRHAYYQRLYDLSKVRMIEGASNGEISMELGLAYNKYFNDSITGNYAALPEDSYQISRLEKVLEIRDEWRMKNIDVAEVYKRLLDNQIYDVINMNTFNFINASFDDLFQRFPTSHEFNTAFGIIEYNQGAVLWGRSATNKMEYIDILIESYAFYEGMVRYMYNTLVGFEPSPEFVYELVTDYYNDKDFERMQRRIMTTNEYAHF